MKTENYTNQPLSKLLNEKMEYESEMSWTITMTTNWHLTNTEYKYLKSIGKDAYPALTFTDLLHWLKLYGKKYGGEKKLVEVPNFAGMKYGKVTTEASQHRILDAYISDNLTIGTNVEKFIREIIK